MEKVGIHEARAPVPALLPLDVLVNRGRDSVNQAAASALRAAWAAAAT